MKDGYELSLCFSSQVLQPLILPIQEHHICSHRKTIGCFSKGVFHSDFGSSVGLKDTIKKWNSKSLFSTSRGIKVFSVTLLGVLPVVERLI